MLEGDGAFSSAVFLCAILIGINVGWNNACTLMTEILDDPENKKDDDDSKENDT